VYCNRYAANVLSCDIGDVVGQAIEKFVSAASKIFVDSYVYPLLLENSNAHEIQLTLTNQKIRTSSTPVVVNIEVDTEQLSLWTFMRCDNRDKLYEELLASRDTLSKQAGELKTLNETIQHERDDLQAFCHSLSHDFTAPIRKIQHLVTYAIEDLRSKNVAVDEELKLLDDANKNAKVLAKLIDGLIEYLTADTRSRVNDTVDLNDIAVTAISLCQDGKPSKIEIGSLPLVTGNSAQLQIVFKNLIANAIKYNEREPEITIYCNNSCKDGFVAISVSDNGIGISSENLEKIFDPFSRLHSEGEYSGSGLGLSIVNKLVSNSGGNISVTSALGIGSTFKVELPLADKESCHS